MRQFWLALIIFGFLGVGSAAAQTDPSFTISPAKREFVVEAGQSVSYVVSVTNNLGSTQQFAVTAQALEGQDPYSLLPYLTVPTSRLTINDGETANFTVNIAVPNNAPPAGLLAGIQVATIPSDRGVAKLSAALQSLIFIRIEGEVNEVGELNRFGVLGGPIQLLKDEVKFYFSYQNEGNVYLNPYGGIEVNKIVAWGKEGSLVVAPNFVLPQQTKTREVKFLPQGACGLYRATLNLNRGYDDVVDQDSTWLVVCSGSGLVVSLIGLVILLGLGLFLMVKFKIWFRER